MITKRFESTSTEEFLRMIDWCNDNLRSYGHFEPNWFYEYPTFYFRDEQDYILFALRWT